jgi:hypothetical protein
VTYWRTVGLSGIQLVKQFVAGIETICQESSDKGDFEK